ncbi:MAG: methyl-accepting chemotaxis protein [Reinekea sp.]|nr:methyl-accepting chemotaxis protein [Reinekea sp.]
MTAQIPTRLSQSMVFKITLAFSVIALIFFANVGKSYFDAQRTQSLLTRMTDEALPIFSSAANLASDVQKLEPVVLAILESKSNAEFAVEQQSYQSLASDILNEITRMQTVDISEPLATKVRQLLRTLDGQITAIGSGIDTLSTQQTELISTISKFNSASQTLNEAENILTPLIGDFVYELTDDYVISLIQELAASANYGMLIIEKLKSANDPQRVDELQTELSSWIQDFDSFFGMLPSVAGDDPALYRDFLKTFSATNSQIKITAQGEYNTDTNDYANGLVTIKQTQVGLAQQQTQALQTFREQMTAILDTTDTIVRLSFDDLQRSASITKTALKTQIWVGLVSGLIALSFVLAISVYLTRYFKTAISKIQRPLHKLALGELHSTHEQAKADEFGRIQTAVTDVSDGLRDIVSGIGQAQVQINDSVDTVSKQSENTLSFVAGQKNELDMVATALTEMSATAHEVAQHASDTLKKVNDAGKVAGQGRQEVGECRTLVEQVSAQTAEAQNVIHSLNNGVQGIESILTTIGGIAEQTNLLALNAAIEAARAGEQGRGFAVVADEVRALASRTQASTLEIQQMTDTMLKESSSAVSVMQQSSELVAKSLESTQRADTTIAGFTGIMEEVQDLSHLIATASEEQAATVNEINNNVLQVSNLAEQTQQSAQAMQAGSHQLADEASTLAEKVSRFKIL